MEKELPTPSWEYPDRAEPCVLAGDFSTEIEPFRSWVRRLPDGYPRLKSLAANGRVGAPLDLAREVVASARLVDSPRVELALAGLSEELLWHLAHWDLAFFPEPDPGELVIAERESEEEPVRDAAHPAVTGVPPAAGVVVEK